VSAGVERSGVASWRDVLAVLVLISLPVLLLGESMSAGKVLATSGLERTVPWASSATPDEGRLPQMNADMVRENLAYRVFLHETLGQGEIPWWSPYMYAGIPFAALNHTQVLYPPMWLAAQFDPFRMYGALTAFHFVVAGLGMFLWLRIAGLVPAAALLGALAFMLNGMFATRHGHPQFLATGCWLPFVLSGVEWLRGRRPWLGMAVVAVSSTLTILAGHPSIYLYGFYFVGAYLLVVLFASTPALDWRSRRLLLLRFAGAFVLGLSLASVQLMATAELSAFSERSVRSLDSLVSRMPHWSHLLRLVFPDVVGNPVHGNYLKFGLASYTAGNLYLGVAPLLLACVGVARGGRRGRALGAIALAVLAIMYLPAVYRVAYWLPGFQFSRIDRLSIAFFLSASFLAGVGLDCMLRGGGRGASTTRARRIAWMAGIGAFGLALAWLASILIPAMAADLGHPTRLMARPEYLERVIAWGAGLWVAAVLCLAAVGPSSRRLGFAAAVAVIALACVDLAMYAGQFVVVRQAERIFRPTPATDFLQAAPKPFRIAKFGDGREMDAVFPANTPMAYGIEDLHGFGPLHVGFIDELLGAVEPERFGGAWAVRAFTDPASLESPVLDLLQVRYVLSDRPLQVRGLHEVHRGDMYIYENAEAYARAFFVPERALVDDRATAAGLLARGTVDPSRIVLLEREQVEGTSIAEADAPAWRGAAEGGRVEVLSRDREAWVLRKVGPGAGYVVLGEPWYPGWRAEIDGSPTALLRADVMLQAVAVEPGEHRIEIRYQPTFQSLSLAISASAGFALLALLGFAVREARALRGTEHRSG
jgi:hypothetical protein